LFKKRNNCLRFTVSSFAVFLVLCVFPLHAQERVISSVEVIGLKRTKPHIARYPLEKFIGREAGSLDFNEVQAAVKDTGILEPLYIEFVDTEEGCTLRVTVDEKWSLIPFPLVISGSGGTSFGLFLLDTNAFGLRDQAALGGMYGSSGWMAMAMYNHTPNRKGQLGWIGSFMYSRREQENQDRDEKTYRLYSADMFRSSFGVYYPFTDHVTASAAASFSGISLLKNNDDLNPPEKGAALLGLNPGLSLRYSEWDGYLLSQQSISLSYHYNFAIYGSSYQKVELKTVFEKPLIPGFRFNFRSGAVWNSSVDPKFEEGPNRTAQVDILPKNFSGRHYAGFSAGLEKHLFKTKMGALSVLGSWQCVFSHGPISGTEFDHGPSGGVRFYLSRLALPAMGFNVAYNMNSRLTQFSFTVGMEL